MTNDHMKVKVGKHKQVVIFVQFISETALNE